LEFLYVNFVLIHTVSVYIRPNLHKDKKISSFRQNHLSDFICLFIAENVERNAKNNNSL